MFLDVSITDAFVGSNFVYTMGSSSPLGLQYVIRIHVLLAEPASKALKRQDELIANTSSPMVAHAAKHDGNQVDHE